MKCNVKYYNGWQQFVQPTCRRMSYRVYTYYTMYFILQQVTAVRATRSMQPCSTNMCVCVAQCVCVCVCVCVAHY